MLKSPAEMEAKDKAAKKDGFAKWMDQPGTRMMLSMIPPGEKQEVLETLLQETFNAGYHSGSGQMILSVFETVMSKEHRDQPR